MARYGLIWTLADLAKVSGVHRNTISNFELKKYVGHPQKIAAIRAALEAAGVEFIAENGGGAGVRLKKMKTFRLSPIKHPRWEEVGLPGDRWVRAIGESDARIHIAAVTPGRKDGRIEGSPWCDPSLANCEEIEAPFKVLNGVVLDEKKGRGPTQ